MQIEGYIDFKNLTFLNLADLHNTKKAYRNTNFTTTINDLKPRLDLVLRFRYSSIANIFNFELISQPCTD